MRYFSGIVFEASIKHSDSATEKRMRSLYTNILDYLNKHTIYILNCYATITHTQHEKVLQDLKRYRDNWVAELGDDCVFSFVPVVVSVSDSDFPVEFEKGIKRIASRKIQPMLEKFETFTRKNPSWISDPRKTLGFRNFLDRMLDYQNTIMSMLDAPIAEDMFSAIRKASEALEYENPQEFHEALVALSQSC